MIKHYIFGAPAHHSFEIGGKTYKGGDTFELDDAFAVDDRLAEIVEANLPEPEPESEPEVKVEPEVKGKPGSKENPAVVGSKRFEKEGDDGWN